MREERVREVMSDLFGVAPNAIGADASPQTIENWDSLQHLNLALALEQEFDIQFTTDEIASLTDFSHTVAAVEKRVQPA